MKNIIVVLVCLSFINCTEKKTEVISENKNKEIISDKNREIDSLKTVINSSKEEQTSDFEDIEKEKPESELNDLSGKHSLTLHWISWEKPGSIHFNKTSENTYNVSGKQAMDGQFVTIDGKITQVSKILLEFEGTIVTNTNLDGKCEKTGKQIFLSTKNRKYWRLQNMDNCKGAVDYIDLYF